MISKPQVPKTTLAYALPISLVPFPGGSTSLGTRSSSGPAASLPFTEIQSPVLRLGLT